MNELYQVLDGLHLNVDFHNEKRLIDDGLLESLDIVMLEIGRASCRERV